MKIQTGHAPLRKHLDARWSTKQPPIFNLNVRLRPTREQPSLALYTVGQKIDPPIKTLLNSKSFFLFIYFELKNGLLKVYLPLVIDLALD